MLESSYLRNPQTPRRIAVIGAGALGSATAYRLAKRGCEVTLIDADAPGMGTTGKSFAWLNAFAKQPRHYHELNAASVLEHALLAQEVGGGWLHLHGGLHWADASDQAALANLATTVDRLRSWGYPIETLTPRFVTRSLEPDLRFDRADVREVYRVPQEGWVHGAAMVRTFVAAATGRHGATLVRGRVLAIHTSSGVCYVEIAGHDPIRVDLVVNAAGPAASEIAEMAEGHISVSQAPGALVLTRPCASQIRHVIHAPQVHLRPDHDGRLMLHTPGYDAFWASSTDRECKPLYEHPVEALAAVAPGLASCEVEEVLVGVRPMPNDGLPIVGFDRDAPLMYHVVAHSGVNLCARLSGLAADEICGTGSAMLEPYGPHRLTETAHGQQR